MALFLAFELQPIRSLHEEWKLIPKIYREQFQMLCSTVNPQHNYCNYRRVLAAVNKFKPFIPIFAVLLKDLTVSEENKTLLSPSLINWTKLTSLSQMFETIRLSISSFSKIPHQPDILNLIHTGFQNQLTLDALYSVSPPEHSPYSFKFVPMSITMLQKRLKKNNRERA